MTPSNAMMLQICSRMRGSPCPEPYCMTCVPLVVIMAAMWAAMSPSGKSLMLGMPPAKDTISGRLATANSARTAETFIPCVRAA